MHWENFNSPTYLALSPTGLELFGDGSDTVSTSVVSAPYSCEATVNNSFRDWQASPLKSSCLATDTDSTRVVGQSRHLTALEEHLLQQQIGRFRVAIAYYISMAIVYATCKMHLSGNEPEVGCVSLGTSPSRLVANGVLWQTSQSQLNENEGSLEDFAISWTWRQQIDHDWQRMKARCCSIVELAWLKKKCPVK